MTLRKSIILLFLALSVVLISVTSCKKEESGDSAEDCMNKFQTAVLSSNWTALKGLTHSGAGQYNSFDQTSWTTWFSSSGFTYSLNGNTATVNSKSTTYYFTLEEDDTDYRVKVIVTSTGTAVFN